ncbi:MAG: hypothetical protein HY761_00395 [Candidatus Omnitrophica bacterium]|nr:hypothetical protein [Candidatus Omnitrophota bacterium]
MKKLSIFLVAILSLSFFTFSFAGDLVSPEAGRYFNEAIKAQKSGDFEKAKIGYNKTLLLDPNNLDWQKFILNNYGIMFVESGDFEKAESAFLEVLEIDPDYEPAKINLGILYDKRKSRLEALEYWAKLYNWEAGKPRKLIFSEQAQK